MSDVSTVRGSTQYIRLEGEAGERYASLARALVGAARLNNFFPRPAWLDSLFDHLRPLHWGSIYPSFDVLVSNGMPAQHETNRVLTDGRLCDKVLGESSRTALESDVAEVGSAAARRRLSRYDYYASLKENPPPTSFSLNLALRRIDTGTRTAYFNVYLDRYDITEGVFVRYTILLSQTANRWKRQQIELVGDDLAYTENFRNIISRFAADEAEFAFVLLADLPNIKVEQVMRCRVGPIYFQGVSMPAAWEALFASCPDALILHMPIDHASLDLPRTGTADPLAVLYRDFLQGEAKATLDTRSKQLGYKVWKERKFTCTPQIEKPLRALLTQLGTPSVVRSVTGAS